MLRERGLEQFSLNELARRIGVSPASAYRHFADKQELLAQISEEGYHELRDSLVRDVAETTPGIRRPRDWTGVYFRGVPVRIAAVPEKGYRFAGWEGTELQEAEITVVPKGDLELAARFEKK